MCVEILFTLYVPEHYLDSSPRSASSCVKMPTDYEVEINQPKHYSTRVAFHDFRNPESQWFHIYNRAPTDSKQSQLLAYMANSI